MSAPLLALLVLLSAGARADKIAIIGDSHTVGPFGGTLDAALRAKGHEVSVNAVCSASGRWWLGPKRQEWKICYFLRQFGDTKAARDSGKYPYDPPFAADIIAHGKPDVVVFALGSNPDGGGVAGQGAVAEALVKLLPSGTRCFWVGPPPMPSRLAAIGQLYNELPQAFSRASKTCELFDSRAVLKSDQATKDHFYGKPAEDWGRAVAAKLYP